jgi:rare lipoprotein A
MVVLARGFSIRAFCFLFLFFFSGCGGHTTRVIDTPETRELPGWQKPYKVDGQRYDPLHSHHGFRQRGIASWYGREFHGRKTSNGEIYDMYALTAAHKTLPLGVSVKVTRRDSGRQVIVRINDRGPFVAGRIIDLSYAAARQLGIVDSGTAPVTVEALGYPQKEQGGITYRAPSDYDSGSFAVQIGAFSSSANAYQLATRMRNSYGKAAVTAVLVNGQRLYRVRVGHYVSLEHAEKAARNLVLSGFRGSFVVAFD